MQYDAAGRIRQFTDERAIARTYAYDTAHRLQNVQFPAHSTQNVAYQYDLAGRPTLVTDSTGSTQFTYDAVRKRLTSVVTTINALPPANRTFTVSYAYYPDGKLASVTSVVGTTQFFYNAAGRLTSQTDPFGNATTYTYDKVGRLLSERTVTTVGVPIESVYAYGVSGQAGDPSAAPAYLRTVTQKINHQAFWTYTLTRSYLGQL